MKQKNILFSTTRQWNPGDEFILFGLENLLSALKVSYNPVIYNRNPAIFRSSEAKILSLKFDFKRMRFSKLHPPEYFDNSFKKRFLDSDQFIDMAIFAGTPEWASKRLDTMYTYIDRHNIPVFYLGVGLNDRLDIQSLSPLYQKVLSKAKLITVRDQIAFQALSSLSPQQLPCPALFSAPDKFEKDILSVRKVGLIFSRQKEVKNNSIDAETFSFMKDFYENLIKNYAKDLDFEFVCHYIDDLPECQRLFPNIPCNYSYDSRSYIKIYNKFDLAIGPRIHGIGLSASMGIPGIAIGHDGRADACKGFLADIITKTDSVDGALKVFENKLGNVSELNKSVLHHKRINYDRYIELLAPFFTD